MMTTSKESRGSAACAHGREPLAIAAHDDIVRLEPADQGTGEIGRPAAFAKPEKRPGPFAETVDQACFGQEPQMP